MTSIETARSVYGLDKRANFVTYLALGGKTLGSLSGFTSAALLALASGAGIAGGWTLAQMTAHNKASVDTAKKEYTRQRLNADLATLTGKVQAEADDIESSRPKQSARVLGN